MNSIDTSFKAKNLDKRYVIVEEGSQALLSSLDFIKNSDLLMVEGSLNYNTLEHVEGEHQVIDFIDAYVFETKEEANKVLRQLKKIDPEQKYSVLTLCQKQVTYWSLD